ncbi:MAG: nuclear transport factor 2 family protein [Saprospiraceae bacterium]|nr:nuclear transport factor 2 family protein [Saprospiraceae bacterium]
MKQKLLLPIFLLLTATLSAQDNTSDVLRLDSLFWQAYNRCDVPQMMSMFTEDIEFYHDKGGPTLGLAKFTQSTEKNLCGNPNFRIYREALPGTVKVFPMHNQGVLYGAILSGEHVFYISENGGKPVLDGQALFTHLWRITDQGWKMSRVLSYNHGPAKK